MCSCPGGRRGPDSHPPMQQPPGGNRTGARGTQTRTAASPHPPWPGWGTCPSSCLSLARSGTLLLARLCTGAVDPWAGPGRRGSLTCVVFFRGSGWFYSPPPDVRSRLEARDDPAAGIAHLLPLLRLLLAPADAGAALRCAGRRCLPAAEEGPRRPAAAPRCGPRQPPDPLGDAGGGSGRARGRGGCGGRPRLLSPGPGVTPCAPLGEHICPAPRQM